MLEIDEAPDKEEILTTTDNARVRLTMWRRRSLYTTLRFGLSCVAVLAFSDLGPLHSLWKPTGEILLLVWMAALLIFVYCWALWWGARGLLRDLENTYS
jgi:hypothetical protein